MTDIDFDELDQAVSAIMSTKTPSDDQAQAKKVKSDEPTPGQPAETDTQVVTTEPTIEEAQADVSEDEGSLTSESEASETATVPDVSEAENSSTVEEPAAGEAPVIVAKKRGQFMDVMHPSADMRTRPEPTSVSRRNAVLKPSASFEKSLAADTAPAVQLSDPQDAPVEAGAQSDDDWPDSIDLVPSETSDTVAAPDTTEPEESTPLVSPFLPDAKPEKRPLGGIPSDDAGASEELKDSSLESGDDVPADSITLMPEELSSDIMDVESGNLPQTSAPAPSPVQPIEEPSEDTRSTGPSSIPQQYKTSEPSANTEHTALYDTASQQDVTHPAKKRSGWLVPLIIILLLILGGAGGYFAYTMHIFG